MRIFILLVLVATIAALVYFKPWVSEGDPSVSRGETVLQIGTPVESPYAMSSDRFVVIDGATIRLREEGPKDAPAIIMLHGFTFSLESFDAWAEELSSDYRVIRFDLLGHGLSGPDAQMRYSNQERVAYLGQVIDALDLDQVHLAGNSLGGLVAWRYASEFPDRVGKLILVSPGAFSINGVTDEPVPVPPAMAYFLKAAPDMGVRASLAFVYADDTKITEDRVELAKAMMTNPGNGDAFVHHLEEFTLPDPTEDLTKVKAPTLIMWGVQDALIPSVQGSLMAEAMPDATLKTYALAGHAAQEELPEDTARDAAAFLGAE